MKRRIFVILLAGLLLLAGAAAAELSTNLQIRTVLNPDNKKTASQTYIDADGNPVIADDKGYATIQYTYVTGNKIGTTEYLDAEGNLINCLAGYARKTVKYSAGKPAITEYWDAEGNPVTGPEGYARQEIKYLYGKHHTTWEYDTEGNPIHLHRITEFAKDKPGLVISDSWYDTEDHLAAGPDGYARVEYEHRGSEVCKTTYLDADGGLYYYEKEGFAVKEYSYANGRISGLCYYGADGELTTGPDGYAKEEITYYGSAYIRRVMYYNADGTPFFTDMGYCGIQRSYRTDGTILEESYFIGPDQRGYSTDGYSRVKSQYTGKGKLWIRSYFDDQDNLMVVDSLGYAMIRYQYGRYGQIWMGYFGAEEEPIIGPDGYYATEDKYTGMYVTETLLYGTDEQLINGPDGYARIEYDRDSNGKAVAERYYDAEGNRFILRDCADEIRNEWEGKVKVSESYWADGEPVVNENGYHGIRYTYTGNNKVSAKTFFDPEGNAVTTADGYARTENIYNSKGKVMAVLYYDADGNLMNAPGKEYAYVRSISVTDKEFLGEETELKTEKALPVGSLGLSLGDLLGETDGEDSDEEDSEEEETEPEEEVPAADTLYIEYYGTDGSRMNLSAGYSTVVRQLDAGGRTVGEAYFDKDGRAVLLADGYHSYRQTIGDDGFPASVSYYGINDEPVIHAKLRCHRIDRTYLDKSHFTSEAWFSTDGKPMTTGDTYVRIEREFDDQGNTTAVRTYGADGSPIARKDGYDEIRQTFNEQNKVSRAEYYLGGKPVLLANGYAALERDYDERGNVACERYFGEDGERKARKEGYDEIHQTFNEQNKVSRAEYYLDGGPVMLEGGYAAVEREYDGNGNVACERYYDLSGGQHPRKQGYDEIRQTFNEQKKVIRVEYHLGGKPVRLANGYAALERDYDGKGNMICERYYDENLEPTACSKGYEVIRKEYDEQNRVIRESYTDHNGAPMTNADGFIAVERTYDSEGNVLTETGIQ